MYSFLSTLTKVDVELPDHPRCRAESLWARPLGGDLYELRTIPCCAEGLGLYDVVRAVPGHEGGVPRVDGVVRKGEPRLLLVAFSTQAGPARRAAMLRGLRDLGCRPEDLAGQLCALVVEPGGDHAAVSERLRSWEEEGLLAHEGLHRRLGGPGANRST